MVVISAPCSEETGSWQERTAAPLSCTVHAPHWPTPQPYLVPLRSSTSRSTQRRGMSDGASTVVGLPFTLRETFIGDGTVGLAGWLLRTARRRNADLERRSRGKGRISRGVSP